MEISIEHLKDNKFAVAVSGGSDSVALLNVLINHNLQDNLTVLHFDHSLRTESELEANSVRKQCEDMGVKCIVGKWQKNEVNGNLQQAARNARYEFFKTECESNNLNCVVVGHTMDDVAETFLMRLARGSGLKGLSTMQYESHVFGIKVIRPLLHIGREELKKYLDEKNITYISDPSNDNDKFFRIRIRKLKQKMHDAGLEYKNICASANSLRRADDALVVFTDKAYNETVDKTASGLLVDLGLLNYPTEIGLRVLEKAILSITGEGLAPRTSKRLRALKAMANVDKRFTLGGVIFSYKNDAYLLEIE